MGEVFSPGSPKQPQDQLIDVFKSVGRVVGFQCVFQAPIGRGLCL